MHRNLNSHKIGLFLPTLDDGGAERVMLQLGESFARRGFEVDLILAIPGGRLQSQVPGCVREIQLGAPRTIHALPAFDQYLRTERPAALLSTLEHANILAVWAGKIAGTGVRVVLREAIVPCPCSRLKGVRQRTQRLLMRRAYPAASALVAVSKSVRQSMIAELAVPPAQVHTIYNPILTESLPRKARATLDDPWFAPGAPPVVLGVGRLAPQKDFPTLLRAFAGVRACRRARLVILGEGDDRIELEALIHQLDLSRDVKLAGFDHNPFRYMSRSAVFALSSVCEGLPGALIQAMACGCRVISTDSPGGSREVLTNDEGGLDGILVPVGDHVSLARGIIDLLDDHAQRGDRARHHLDRYSEERVVSQYLGVLGMPVSARIPSIAPPSSHGPVSSAA